MYWSNNAIEPDKMTLADFLEYLTDINWHTERVLVETIIDGRDKLINDACEVRLQHTKDNCMTRENLARRQEIIEALNEE